MALADLALPSDPATTPECDPGLDASSPLRTPSGSLFIQNGTNDNHLRAPELEET